MKYHVEVVETRAKIVEIEADTLGQAQDIARDRIDDIRGTLSSDNWLCTEVRILDEEYSPLWSDEQC